MWKDPIVEEIRQHSQRYAAQFDFELPAIFRDLREKQKRSGCQAVSLPPKRLSGHGAAEPQPEEISLP